MNQLSGHDNGGEPTPAEPGPDSGQGTTSSERVLANAAHTLCAIKRTLSSDIGHFEKELTYRAGTEMFHCYMVREFGKADPPDRRVLLHLLTDLFAKDGLGTFEVVTYDQEERLIVITCPDSLEALGYLSHGELQKTASCSFTCGLLAGLGKHVFGSTDCEGPNEIVATEVFCASKGDPECRFLVGKRAKLDKLGHTVEPVKESVSEHALRLNDEILSRNLELQNLNLDLERLARRRTEELKRSEDSYRALVNLSPDPIIVCLLDGTIKSVNDSAMGMLGYNPGDPFEPTNISSLLLDGANAWERCVWLVNKEGVLRGHEFDFVRKKGGKVVGEVSARVADMLHERCVHLVIRDVTERNLLKARMEEAKAECEFFNDLLSHDIVNYMSAAMHFLEKMPASRDLTDDDRRAIAIVTKDVRGAYELASVVRDLARAEALGENDCRDAVDVCGLMSDAVEDARRMYSERKVSISVDRTAPTCYAEGSTLLTRLFVNQLTNAIKFDPSDEAIIDVKIEPVTHKGTEFWSVRVADHGKGIPDHEKEKVFERYFRGDTGISGTGLGLHVVRKIARACGGLVWAENRVQGDYTKGTVVVTLLRKAQDHQNNHKH